MFNRSTYRYISNLLRYWLIGRMMLSRQWGITTDYLHQDCPKLFWYILTKLFLHFSFFTPWKAQNTSTDLTAGIYLYWPWYRFDFYFLWPVMTTKQPYIWRRYYCYSVYVKPELHPFLLKRTLFNDLPCPDYQLTNVVSRDGQ